MPRDPRLADDHTDILTLVKSDLPRIRESEPSVQTIACILPTALLMSSGDLRAAVDRVRSGGAKFVVSIGRFHYPIQRALRQTHDGRVEMVDPSSYLSRSQDLEPRFHDAGQFYVGTPGSWEQRATVFDSPLFAQQIDDHRVCDVDVEEDWQRAELLWSLLGGTRPAHG
jgi:CMP-N-acetylneuraminic acid synthetase